MDIVDLINKKAGYRAVVRYEVDDQIMKQFTVHVWGQSWNKVRSRVRNINVINQLTEDLKNKT